MQEIWLRPNRRAIAAVLILPAAGVALGISLAGVSASTSGLRWSGIGLMALSAVAIALCLRQLLRPRIARQGDDLLFYLRRGAPLRVPLEYVEAFLMGQGPSYLSAAQPAMSQAATIVIRLADRATDFARRDVNPALGTWCNHYVTIRGTWCEPLSVPLVTRLNQRLAAAHAPQPTEPLRR